MNLTNKFLTIAFTASLMILGGCSNDDDDDTLEEIVPTVNEESSFSFRTESPDAYTRVDRMGMPAIATALIASKDSYNSANPTDDIGLTFVPEILASLEFLHTALDSQLQGLGLTPCTVVGDGTGSCAAFAVPLIIPDTIKIDTTIASGFPNGRGLSAPVIDVTLAVALLELTGEDAPHTAVDLVGVLNPPANDREFSESFPYLASPN